VSNTYQKIIFNHETHLNVLTNHELLFNLNICCTKLNDEVYDHMKENINPSFKSKIFEITNTGLIVYQYI